jgi:hypothetical protein
MLTRRTDLSLSHAHFTRIGDPFNNDAVSGVIIGSEKGDTCGTIFQLNFRV